ncbi:MAG TPA: hypothetical protein VN934_07245 [Candidatus Tumulicola sp.]|nr:hypothetical protein [Candidatus Tumulicola sp.]
MRHVLLLGAAAFAAAMAACTASSYSGLPFGPQPPPPVVTTFNVPASDTEPAASGTTWDVLSVQTSRTGPAGSASYTNIAITLTFMQTNAFASLPPPGSNIGSSGTLLGLFFLVDADQNSSTGVSGNCGGFSYGTGFDHGVDGGASFPRLADGNFQIFSLPGRVGTGEATVSGSGGTVTVNVPITALGGTGQTNMFMGTANATGLPGVTTDCVPDASTIQT